jgi:hypothetical protein
MKKPGTLSGDSMGHKNRGWLGPYLIEIISCKLVEAAGVEPASANSPYKLLHA